MPEEIKDREQLYALIHEFDDRVSFMESILTNYLSNNGKSMDSQELYLIQSYCDHLKFLEAKYERIDKYLSTNSQNRES